MRRVLTIDIETLPTPEMSLVSEGICKDSDEHLKTALSGDYGKILCIGYIDENTSGNYENSVIGWDEIKKEFHSDETTILTEFWKRLSGFQLDKDRIVGHNIYDFDLKFIYKRSIINRIRPTINFSFARYRNYPIFDTMWEWERWSQGSKISLDKLARVLGFPSPKISIDGSNIYELFKNGQHEEIYHYCLRDVAITRDIYKRMVFANSSLVHSNTFTQFNLDKSA